MRCCCRTRNDLASVFGCLSLALFALLFGVILTAYAAYTIAAAVLESSSDTTSITIGCVYGGIQVFFGALLIVSVLTKWTKGLSVLIFVTKFMLVAWVVGCVMRWVIWIGQMQGKWTDNGGKWKPAGSDWASMIITTIIAVVFIALAWYIISGLKSLKSVFQAGGTGFEKLSYKNIKTGAKTMKFDDYSDDDSSSV